MNVERIKVLKSGTVKIWRSNEVTEENLAEQSDAFTNMAKQKAKMILCFMSLILKAGDNLFTGNGQLKTNTV